MEAQSRGTPAIVNLPRARWNAVAFRVATEGNSFYSCHWAKDENGDIVALVVDFAYLRRFELARHYEILDTQSV